MPIAETAQLLVQLNLQDNLTGAAASVGQKVVALNEDVASLGTSAAATSTQVDTLNSSAAKTDINFRSAHASAREFTRASNETLVVVNALSGAIGESNSQIAQFIRVGGDLVLAGTAYADLGPRIAGGLTILNTKIAEASSGLEAMGASALKGIAGLFGLGGASVGTTAAVTAEGVAASTATAETAALGTAAAAATPEVAGLGVAGGAAAIGTDALATGAGGAAAAVGGLGAATTVAGASVAASLLSFGPLAAVLIELYQVIQHLTSGTGDLNTGLNQNKDAVVGWIATAGQQTGAARLASDQIQDLSGHVDESTRTLAGFSYQLTQNAGNLDSFGNDIDALGGSIEEKLIPDLGRGKDETQNLIDTLLSIPTTIESTVRVNIIQTVQGAGVETLPGAAHPLTGDTGSGFQLVPDGKGGYTLADTGTGARGGNAPVPFNNLSTLGSSIAQQARDLRAAIDDAKKALATNTDPTATLDLEKRLRDAKEAYINFNNQQAADAARRAQEAANKAKQLEQERQRAIAAAITDTYRTAKGLEDDYFARVHANRLKQIQDTLALAQAQHDAAVKAINDALQTQLANNAKPVTAAQAALTNTQNQEQLRNLQEAADAAYTALQNNADPAQAQALQQALRDAREAVANFKAQLNITNLQTAQQVADDKAKADAKAKIAAADAVLAAADAKAKKDTLTENQRYATIQKRFNDDLDKVLKETIKKHKSMNDALQALINLIAHFGGTSAGIPKVKQGIEVPRESQQVHVTVNVPPITIGARAVTNALSTQITPSQSPFARTGQVRPKFSPGN